MQFADFTVSVRFDDGVNVTLGGDNELFVENTDETGGSCLLNDDRLNLIRLLRLAENEAVNGD
jgi:hypothetical protein